jgi:hypothetical protein
MDEEDLLKRVEDLLQHLNEQPDHAKLRRLSDDMRALADRLRSEISPENCHESAADSLTRDPLRLPSDAIQRRVRRRMPRRPASQSYSPSLRANGDAR